MKDIKKILKRINKLINNIEFIDGKIYVYGQYFKHNRFISITQNLTVYLSYYDNLYISLLCFNICRIQIRISNDNSILDNDICIYKLKLLLDGTIVDSFDDLPSNIFDWHEEEFFYWNLKYGS